MLVLPALVHVQNFLANHETLLVGGVTYVGGLLLLNMLESTRIKNGLGSTLPQMVLGRDQLTPMQRQTKWITPTTMDAFRPVPLLSELQEKPYLLGVKAGASQFITLEKGTIIKGIQEEHKEWTELYGQPVFIFKKKIV